MTFLKKEENMNTYNFVFSLSDKFEVSSDKDEEECFDLEEEFASFLTFKPISSLNLNFEQDFSCELDEKAFIQEIIHSSNNFNFTWLKE